MRLTTVAAALAVSVVLASACSVSIGPSRSLDAREVEAEVVNRLGDDVGVPIDDAECPGGIGAEVGATFECSISLDDKTATVVVTQTDDAGNLDFETRGLIVTAKLVDLVVGGFALYGVTVTAECGLERVVLVDEGDTIECRATHTDGRVVLVTATVTDGTGRVTLAT